MDQPISTERRWQNRGIISIPRIPDIPGNTVIALDVHGTLISRNQADDLGVVQTFRQLISRPATESGAKVILVSAAPTRELQRVASLLDLGNQPAVAELGHVIMPAVLAAPPGLASGVTDELYRALLDLKRWLGVEGLPPGIFLEPKTVLVTLNCSQASQERDRLAELIQGYIDERGLPLYVSMSDATLDVGIAGLNKASGLATVMTSLGAGAAGVNIVAVGDSRNDLDLLKVASAGLCGCPANSHPTVKDFVRAQGGVVTEQPNLAGTLDALSQLIERMSGRRVRVGREEAARVSPATSSRSRRRIRRHSLPPTFYLKMRAIEGALITR